MTTGHDQLNETPKANEEGFFGSRAGWRELNEKILLEPIKGGSRWAAAFGSLLLFAFTLQVVTGISLIHLRAHRERTFAVSTDVTFRPLTAGQINDYLSKMNPLDKAGAYAIQEHGDLIVAEISGSYSNVVGLPVEQLKAELEMWK